jgi:hypothetical protein
VATIAERASWPGSASNRVLTGLLDRLLRGRYPAGCKQNRGFLRGRAFVF